MIINRFYNAVNVLQSSFYWVCLYFINTCEESITEDCNVEHKALGLALPYFGCDTTTTVFYEKYEIRECKKQRITMSFLANIPIGRCGAMGWFSAVFFKSMHTLVCKQASMMQGCIM